MFGVNRKKIVIFGSGSGGISAYKSLSNQYGIIGFIDNDKAKQGTKCCGKTVFSPDSLTELSYSKIIVASDYSKEITEQLINKLKIPENKISYFSSTEASNIKRYSLFGLINKLFYFLLNRMPFKGVYLFYSIIGFFCKNYRSTKVLPIHWLDQAHNHIIQNLQLGYQQKSYGPNFIHRQQTIKNSYYPDLNVYILNNAITTTTSRSWITDEKIYIERLPYIDKYLADYASGQVLYHGAEFALVNKGNPIKIKEGIVITGVSDTNYYHWLIEIIPQLFWLSHLSESIQKTPLLISEKIKEIPSIYEVFKCLSIENNIIYLKSNQKYLINNLLVISSPNLAITHLKETHFSPVESSYFHANSLWLLRNKILENLTQKQLLNIHTPKYIFLARKGNIRQYNQNEVVQLLHLFGFSVIYLEDLSFPEQVSYMRGADVIVSPSGAALANLVFAKEGADVLYWAALSNGDASCFSNIAKIMNINLDCIGYDIKSNSTRETYHLPYKINCNEITAWLNIKLPKQRE